MFLDRHDGIDATPEAIAEAHVADLSIEDRYGVRYHTYWFDPASHSVFCLAEGPNRDAVEAVHRDSHGLLADQVIEVPPMARMQDMFGSMPSHPAGEAYTASAIRSIVFTDVNGSVEQVHVHGEDTHLALLDVHDALVRDLLGTHNGREVKHTGDGIMAAFTSVSSSVRFATGVLEGLSSRADDGGPPLTVSIGISAGEPVTRGSEDLFGAAVQIAARLCAAAEPAEVLVSGVVRELCAGKGFTFQDRGELALKGVPEPTRAFAVSWVNSPA
jgi:class 3 adenylate cyclase